MKKTGLFVIAFLTASCSFAQGAPKFGIKGGLNVAATSNTVTGQSGSKAGVNLGFLAHVHLTPEISLQPEIYYSGQGAKVVDVTLNLNYINIPLLAQYNFDNGFRLQTGPQVGLLVDVNDKFNGANSNTFSSDDFKTTDFSWSFGLGYLLYSGLGIDGRYNLGISKINDSNANFGKTTNRVFQLGLFYLFDHSHKARSK